MGPLLYQRLRAHEFAAAAPSNIMQALREAYVDNSTRNLRLHNELRTIVTALSTQGIPVIVLKGTYLASVVYDNIALRWMGDIDLLVRRNDVARVADTLMALGYRTPESPSMDIDAWITMRRHLPKFVKRKIARVEVHPNITEPNSQHGIDVDELWDRALPAGIAGVEVLGLSREDLLLHLCFHTSYQHQFAFGLRPFCDIDETIRYYGIDIDWMRLRQRADRWGWDRGVYLALYLAKNMLCAAVPDSALRGLKPSAFDDAILAAAKEQVFTSKPVLRTLSLSLAQVWEANQSQDKTSHLLEGVLGRLRYKSSAIAASSVFPRSVLYHVVYLSGMIARNIKPAWRLLRGDRKLALLAKRRNTLSRWLSEK